MKKLLLYILPLLMLLSIIIFKSEIIRLIINITLLIGIIILYGFPKDRNYLKGNAIRFIIISILSYFIINYSLGVITSFYKNPFKLDIISIINNSWIVALTIIIQEIIRHIYAKKCSEKISPYILLTIVYIILNILMDIKFISTYNNESIFIFLCVKVIPCIFFQSVYSYITYKISYIPTLILRLILGLYVYILPIIPTPGNYITSVLGVLYPSLIFIYINNILLKQEKRTDYLNKFKVKYLYAPIIVIFIVLTILVSGIGNYYLISIASGSMEPIYYRGDAVLIDKSLEKSEYKIGDILAYNNSGRIVTHRIVGKDFVNNKYFYKTKGDNNNNIDEVKITEQMVIGKVIYKINYIGFPTVWFNDLLGKI